MRVKKVWMCFALLSPILPALGDSTVPRDVQKFIARREGCDHMRGEMPEPGEQQRIKDLNREIEKLCKGTDQELAKLKRKYAANSSVLQRLDEFEDAIEASQAPASGNKAGRQAG